MKIYIDIDETICVTPADRNYLEAKPIKANIEMANSLYYEGHEITYYTARGSASGKDWRNVTENQLTQWGCKYHALQMGKPAYDLLIDDKTLNTRTWERKGNDIVRSQMAKTKKPLQIRPNSKFRFLLEGKLGDHELKPTLVRCNSLPTISLHEEVVGKDTFAIKTHRWLPISFTFQDLNANEERFKEFASFVAHNFNSCATPKDKSHMDHLKLIMYDASDIICEWVLGDVCLQQAGFNDITFSDLDESDFNIDITANFQYVEFIQHRLTKPHSKA